MDSNGSTGEQQSTFIAHVYSDLESQLHKFWEIEGCQGQNKYPEEELAEKHFLENVQRLKDGRHMVWLPFKDNSVELGKSKTQVFSKL